MKYSTALKVMARDSMVLSTGDRALIYDAANELTRLELHIIELQDALDEVDGGYG